LCLTLTISGGAERRPLDAVGYARHERDLMGCKSPVCKPGTVVMTESQIPAEGKGGTARDRPEEAWAQSYEPTNRNGIQGQVPGQVSTTWRSPGFGGHGKCRGCV